MQFKPELNKKDIELLHIIANENAIVKIIKANCRVNYDNKLQHDQLSFGQKLDFIVTQLKDRNKNRSSFLTSHKKDNVSEDLAADFIKNNNKTIETTLWPNFPRYMELPSEKGDDDIIVIWELGFDSPSSGPEQGKCTVKIGKNGEEKHTFEEMEKIRMQNREAVALGRKLSHSGYTAQWNVILSSPPGHKINGLAIKTSHSLLARIKLLATMYYVKKRLTLTEDIPLLLVPIDKDHYIYNHTQRLNDVLRALSKSKTSYAYRVLVADHQALLINILKSAVKIFGNQHSLIDSIIQKCKSLDIKISISIPQQKNRPLYQDRITYQDLHHTFIDAYRNNDLINYYVHLPKLELPISIREKIPNIMHDFVSDPTNIIPLNPANKYIIDYLIKAFDKYSSLTYSSYGNKSYASLRKLYDAFAELSASNTKLNILFALINKKRFDLIPKIIDYIEDDLANKDKNPLIETEVQQLFASCANKNIIKLFLFNASICKVLLDKHLKQALSSALNNYWNREIILKILTHDNLQIDANTILEIYHHVEDANHSNVGFDDVFKDFLWDCHKFNEALCNHEDDIANHYIASGRHATLLEDIKRKKLWGECVVDDNLLQLALRDDDTKLIKHLLINFKSSMNDHTNHLGETAIDVLFKVYDIENILSLTLQANNPDIAMEVAKHLAKHADKIDPNKIKEVLMAATEQFKTSFVKEFISHYKANDQTILQLILKKAINEGNIEIATLMCQTGASLIKTSDDTKVVTANAHSQPKSAIQLIIDRLRHDNLNREAMKHLIMKLQPFISKECDFKTQSELIQIFLNNGAFEKACQFFVASQLELAPMDEQQNNLLHKVILSDNCKFTYIQALCEKAGNLSQENAKHQSAIVLAASLDKWDIVMDMLKLYPNKISNYERYVIALYRLCKECDVLSKGERSALNLFALPSMSRLEFRDFHLSMNQYLALEPELISQKMRRYVLLNFIDRYVAQQKDPHEIVKFIKSVENETPYLFETNRLKLFDSHHQKNKLISTDGANIYRLANNRILHLTKNHQIHTEIDQNQMIKTFLGEKYNQQIFKIKSDYSKIFARLHHKKHYKRNRAETKLKNSQNAVNHWLQKLAR